MWDVDTVVRYGGLARCCNRHGVCRGLDFRIPRKHVLKLLNGGNAKGAAAVGVLDNCLRPRSNRYHVFNRGVRAVSPTLHEGVNLLLRKRIRCRFVGVARVRGFCTSFCPKR